VTDCGWMGYRLNLGATGSQSSRNPLVPASTEQQPPSARDGANVTAPPVTDARWDAEVLEADSPVIVAFHAPWSSPSQAFDPTIDSLAVGLADRATVLALDMERNPAAARRYDVSSLPTLLIFRDGRLVGRVVGARPMERLLVELASYLPTP
jgi:thioredoxin 1